jgi:hypothetical protein
MEIESLCPCGYEYVCPCSTCVKRRKNIGDNLEPWIKISENVEQCPKCGKAESVDWWMDRDYELYEKAKAKLKHETQEQQVMDVLAGKNKSGDDIWTRLGLN